MSSRHPVPSLLAALRSELCAARRSRRWRPTHVERFVAARPAGLLRAGRDAAVAGRRPGAASLLHPPGPRLGQQRPGRGAGGFDYEPGDLFPVGAALGARAVTSTYSAHDDTFCLQLPLRRACTRWPRDSAPLRRLPEPAAAALPRAVAARAAQVAYSSQTLAEQSLETPLGDAAAPRAGERARRAPLREALCLMHERRIGSVLVVDRGRAPRRAS